MAVYLGSSGIIQLSRSGEGSFDSILDSGDVNVPERRFSFDFPNGTFISGDRLSIARLKADLTPSDEPLDFVDASAWGDGIQHSDGTFFVGVDLIGGIRLYSTWDDALSGRRVAAFPLHTPASAYKIRVKLVDSKPHCLGQVLDYSFSTQRDTADVTSLGDAFAQKYSTLISGSGQLRAYWDWAPSTCGVGSVELAQYLHQLILRQQLGSEFKADLIVKRDGATPIDEDLTGAALRTAIYYTVTGVVTNVSMAFNASSPIESVVQFATTGPIQLLYGVPSAYLILQEDGGKLSMEDLSGYLAQEDEV